MFVLPCVCPKWFTSSQSSKVDIPLAPAVFLEAGSDYKHVPWSTIQNTVIYLVYHTCRINLALEIQNPPKVYEDGYCTWPFHHQKKLLKYVNRKIILPHFTSFWMDEAWRGSFFFGLAFCPKISSSRWSIPLLSLVSGEVQKTKSYMERSESRCFFSVAHWQLMNLDTGGLESLR